MNVFILDRDMEESAAMLDDAHLKAQINEACQILMANWNHEHFPDAKIGHLGHTVTKFYSSMGPKVELLEYLPRLFDEYLFRFGKEHQNRFWYLGFCEFHGIPDDSFKFSKTYVNGIMTDDIAAIRHYIMTNLQQKKPVWTNREKPEWWEL